MSSMAAWSTSKAVVGAEDCVKKAKVVYGKLSEKKDRDQLFQAGLNDMAELRKNIGIVSGALVKLNEA